MYSQPGFGRRLRKLRRDRDLSQVELAGGELSSSYVSMVENGRRVPTRQVVEQFAEQLGLPVEYFDDPRDGPAGAGAEPHTFLTDFLDHQTARRDGELDIAVKLLREVETRATADGDAQIVWSARWDLSEVLLELDLGDERVAVLESLLADPLTRSSTRLEAKIRSALGGALRQAGNLRDGVDQSGRAVSVSRTLPAHAPERAEALLSLMAALTEGGQLDPAVGVAEEVHGLLDHITSRQLRGSANWAVGNVWFRVGRIADAVAAHDEAFVHLRPDINLRRWARLSKASAAMRLEAGQDADVTRRLLVQARNALDLVGTETDRVELLAVEAAQRLADLEPQGAIELGARVIAQGSKLAAQDLASCLMVVAGAHDMLGERAAAAATYREAATLFESAGAFQRAAELWRKLACMLESEQRRSVAGGESSA